VRQVCDDLWETRADAPFPGLTTHAYLWTPPSAENVLFYATAGDAEFDDLDELGGVAHQYLSHRDEASPPLRLVADRFGSVLHAPAAEVADIGEFVDASVLYDRRGVDANGIEVVPTPGHSPGSTCFVVPGAGGSYLFTGDTLLVGRDGRWTAGFVPGVSDAAALASSLRLLATLEPDVVVSSAFTGDAGAHRLGGTDWQGCIAEALDSLPD